MNKNINSFSDNIKNLVDKTNIAISSLNGFSETFTTDDDVVNIKISDDSSIQIPSYQSLLNRIKTVENTVNTFTSGAGTVKLVDGTYRQIKVSTIPQAPNKITDLENPIYFKTNSNWFFEDLVFPKLIVSIDVSNKVEDDSDRIQVCRIILQKNNNENFYNDNIKNKKLSYNDLLNLLNDNNINYYEDIETINFPLTSRQYIGDFEILNYEIINGEKWYLLNDVYYGINNENDTNVLKNIFLKINDVIRYKNSLYTISDIDLTTKKVKLQSNIGLDVPYIGETITIYEKPFAIKNVEIGIGIDEINVIYFKGINESYNLMGDEWSEPIDFISNELINENNETLEQYYYQFVADFGAEWISQAKERRIPAYNGITPNIPELIASNFKVVQINTQVNATLDRDEIKKTASQIATLKTTISSNRDTISKLKSNLTTTSKVSERFNLQNLITNEEASLSTNTTEYMSLVNHLNSYIKENSASVTSPKYRVRGFFAIPEPQYIYNDKGEKISKQEIIGFDIKYRYIKNDETGVDLGTYNYTDGSANINAVFSDWNYISSKLKEKKYNKELDAFEWVEENVSDGNAININQIDIPINDGEKVEFVVRSISEAGYPSCPLKSNWSNSIIIEFPSNLSTTDQLLNILEDAKSDATSIQFEEVLRSAGYYDHIADETISPTDNTLTYHHASDNIYYKNSSYDENNNEIITTISMTEVVKILLNKINDLEKKISDTSTALTLKFDNNNYLINRQIEGIKSEKPTTTILDASSNSIISVNDKIYSVKFDENGKISGLIDLTTTE